MRLLAIDPGTTESAYVLFDLDERRLINFGKIANADMVCVIKDARYNRLAIEMIKSYGNAMGDSILMTCVWIGRFIQSATDTPIDLIPRKTIVTALCNNPRATDTHVRAALVDIYTTDLSPAIGTKKSPGQLYGVKKDVWAALALATVWKEVFDSILN